MEPDGDQNYGATAPAVANNGTDNQYLVVWSGDDDTGDNVNEEFENYGQLIDGSTGEEIGEDFRLSEMGPDGNTKFAAWSPAVAHNRKNNEYLVV